MKRHYPGATYDLTQENLQGLIEQLETANVRRSILSGRIDHVKLRTEAMALHLAKAEAVLAEIAWFGSPENLEDHDYQGDGHSARDYFVKAYGSNYCAVRDADFKLQREKQQADWKETACANITEVLEKAKAEKDKP